MIKFILLFALFPFLVLANPDDVRAFAENISKEIIAIAENPQLDEEARLSAVNGLIDEYIDFESVSRFVLGKYWRTLKDDQKAEFLAIYRDYMKRIYTPKFKEYKGEKLDITEVREASKDVYILKSRFNRENAEAIFIDFRIRKFGDEYRIIDIIGEGVSLLQTQREEYNSVISRQGFDALIGMLKDKTS